MKDNFKNNKSKISKNKDFPNIIFILLLICFLRSLSSFFLMKTLMSKRKKQKTWQINQIWVKFWHFVERNGQKIANFATFFWIHHHDSFEPTLGPFRHLQGPERTNSPPLKSPTGRKSSWAPLVPSPNIKNKDYPQQLECIRGVLIKSPLLLTSSPSLWSS